MRVRRLRLIAAAAVTAAAAALTPAAVQAACHDALMPLSGLQFRRSLGAELRDIGITGFGRTQPYRDATISVLLGTEVSLIIREQDDLAVEIGAELPLPAEPIELAKFNALVSHIASRFSGEAEPQVRARLLASTLAHGAPGTWSETSGPAVLSYARTPDSLLAKLRLQKCE